MTDDQSVTLRDYFERRLADLQDAHKREHEGLAREVIAAKVEIDRQLREMNEVRAQINRERNLFATNDKLGVVQGSIGERIDALATQVTAATSRISNIEGRFWALGVGVAIFSLALKFLPFGN